MTQTTPRILVVEDNEVNATLIRFQLSHLGYPDVTVFNEGGAALHWFNQNECHLVLTDIQMQPIDGFELTRQIRNSDLLKSRHTPVVAATAGAMPENLQRCIDQGMDDVLTKPIQLEPLRQMVEKWTSAQTNR